MSAATSGSVLLAMSAPAYWHCGRTIRKISFYAIMGCMPAVLMALWNWGLPAARVMALSVVVCVAVEALCEKAMGREVMVDDLTAVYAGLLFAFLLPAASPWWLVVLGAGLCMVFGKMVFGGLGANPVSTPLVGWAILAVSFPLFMDANAMQLQTDFLDPLVRLKFFGAAAAGDIPLADLLLGRQIDGLGAGQVLGLFMGGSFLCARGIVRWQVSLGFFLGVCGLAALFQMLDPAQNASPLFHLCTGSVMLGGFFMATEIGNTPSRPLPMFLYGLLGGVLPMLSASRRVLTASLCHPLPT
jgi:electron transport complex protein RnfD